MSHKKLETILTTHSNLNMKHTLLVFLEKAVEIVEIDTSF